MKLELPTSHRPPGNGRNRRSWPQPQASWPGCPAAPAPLHAGPPCGCTPVTTLLLGAGSCWAPLCCPPRALPGLELGVASWPGSAAPRLIVPVERSPRGGNGVGQGPPSPQAALGRRGSSACRAQPKGSGSRSPGVPGGCPWAPFPARSRRAGAGWGLGSIPAAAVQRGLAAHGVPRASGPAGEHREWRDARQLAAQVLPSCPLSWPSLQPLSGGGSGERVPQDVSLAGGQRAPCGGGGVQSRAVIQAPFPLGLGVCAQRGRLR